MKEYDITIKEVKKKRTFWDKIFRLNKPKPVEGLCYIDFVISKKIISFVIEKGKGVYSVGIVWDKDIKELSTYIWNFGIMANNELLNKK